ncbi:meiosis-specific nuclear structural protein 1-like [Diprion similis]|uniref:meiosis-specific nuclear structural protein 1-like n=1 Tax=Diprion similis TaxID=362088 RepID=UPI001EF9776C|nr:meiosis-specific nuclear structural protein 1-like [Diprion similis]
MEGVKKNGKGAKRYARVGDIRDSNKDLRQLEAALREAYVAKELRAQLCEAEAERLGERARDRAQGEALRRVAEEAARASEATARIEKSVRIGYGLELREAAAERERKRIASHELELRECRILAEVSRAVEEAREADKIAAKLELAQRTARELRVFTEIKEIRRSQEAEAAAVERLRELEYVAEVERRTEALRMARDERELARATVIEAVAKGLLEARDRKLEREELLADLVAEERWLLEEARLREEKQRRKRAREEAAVELERHRVIVEERRLRHAIEEEEFAAAVMRRVMEDNRVQRLTAEARRRIQIEYRRGLELVIEERRARRAQEVLRLQEELRLERARNAAIEKGVKEMRRMLLNRHAGNVAEFIAAGALSSDERAVVAAIIDTRPKDGAQKSGVRAD